MHTKTLAGEVKEIKCCVHSLLVIATVRFIKSSVMDNFHEHIAINYYVSADLVTYHILTYYSSQSGIFNEQL